MPVTYEGAGTFVGGAAAITPGMPAGIQANDILLLFVETANQAASLSTPNGFAVVGTPAGTGTAAGTSSTRITVFWKRAVGGDAAPVIADSGDHQSARIGLWRGVRTSGNPWGTVTPVYTAVATSSTAGSANGVTTAVADCGIVVGVANMVDTNTGQTVTYSAAAVPGLTGTGMGDNSNAGNGGGLNVGFAVKAAAGATGAISITHSAATVKSYVVIPLEPFVASAPSAPTITSAAANGNDAANVFFNAPANDGGSAILDYRVTANRVGGGTPVTGTTGGSPYTLFGLSPSTSYTITVAARNATGYSAESAPSAQFTTAAPAQIGRSPVSLTFDWEIQ